MFRLDYKDPRTLFILGFVLVLASHSIPLIPNLPTFIHMWRAELPAAVVLLTSLAVILYRSAQGNFSVKFGRHEMFFIVLPILAFIAWSGASTIWASSWRSAVHHTLVWILYLIFYVLARNVTETGKGYRAMLAVVTLTLVVISIPAIFEYASLLVFGGGTSIGIRYARYGEQVNTILPLLFAGVIGLKGRQFTVGLAAMTALWLLIFVSLGRTNIALFLCVIATISVCVFLFKRFYQYRLKAVLVLVVLIAAPLPLHLFSLLSDDPNIPVVRRVNDNSGIKGSNDFRKLMAAISLEMFKQHPISGVGADNFGMQLNDYRAVHAVENPTDPSLVNAENEIPERSHNEYLQILAELGVVGGLIFAWLLCGIGFMAFEALRSRRSLTTIAAVAGVLVFITSSLVTSYSFRLIQNGFVFFFVLAVASKLLLKPRERNTNSSVSFSAGQVRVACCFGIAACLLLTAYSTVRVTSVIYTERADKETQLGQAVQLYTTAISLDSENPNAEFNLAYRLMDAKRYDEASVHFERSIKIGRAPSVSYSYLATAYLMAGNTAAAAAAFSNAVKLYPLSPFARTRYAFLLQKNGEVVRSAEEIEQSRSIDRAATETWWVFMNEGAKKATENANKDQTVRAIMDLAPSAAVYAVLAERIIDHPDEKSTFDFMK